MKNTSPGSDSSQVFLVLKAHTMMTIVFVLSVFHTKAQNSDSVDYISIGEARKIKVRYELDGKRINASEKAYLVEKYSELSQEFNIVTANGDTIAVVSYFSDGAPVTFPKKISESRSSANPTLDISRDLRDFPFPDFHWTGIDGKQYNLDALRGKVVVLNFWHTSCGPCVAEMPLLNDLKAKHINNQVVFIASTSNTKEQLQNFLKQRKFSYEQVFEVDPRSIFDPFPGWPIHVVLDKKGIIQFMALGKQQGIENRLARAIDQGLLE